jgi:hypothetical protein
MAEFFFHRLLADPLVTVVGSGKTELWPGIVYTALVGGGRPAHVMIPTFDSQFSQIPKRMKLSRLLKGLTRSCVTKIALSMSD